MKKIKNIIIIWLIIITIFLTIYGVGYVKYLIWRAEHPQAKTWLFFIPRD